jgi:fructoselysine 6-phosphate deglycase
MKEILEKYTHGLGGASEVLAEAGLFGEKKASQGINRLCLIGCGAPNRVMASVKYWVDRYSASMETHLFFPAEFIHQAPVKMDDRTLVVLISETGSTPEVVEAVRYIRQHYPSETVSISARADAPLASFTTNHFSYGEGRVGFEAKFMVLMALVSAMLQARGEWDLHGDIMTGLGALPSAMADAEINTRYANEDWAKRYRDEEFYFVTASGPCYPVAYSLGVCILMEALWVKMFEGEAAEFFHGSFEALDGTVPVILFLGEDPSRPLAERVKNFLSRKNNKTLLYDSRDYVLKGVPAAARPVLTPYVLGAASFGFAEALSRLRGQPLSTRRYMGKMDY